LQHGTSVALPGRISHGHRAPAELARGRLDEYLPLLL